MCDACWCLYPVAICIMHRWCCKNVYLRPIVILPSRTAGPLLKNILYCLLSLSPLRFLANFSAGREPKKVKTRGAHKHVPFPLLLNCPAKRAGNPIPPLPLAAHKSKIDTLVRSNRLHTCAHHLQIYICVTKLLEVQNLNFICIWANVLDPPHCFSQINSTIVRKIENQEQKLKIEKRHTRFAWEK